MKKEFGFTLIELMVVMAVIAILATAGLSAYTGYIKKARDTTRKEDLRAMDTIMTGMGGSFNWGSSDPEYVAEATRIFNTIKEFNNGQYSTLFVKVLCELCNVLIEYIFVIMVNISFLQY